MTSIIVAADNLLHEESETLKIIEALCETNIQFVLKANLDFILSRGYAEAFKILKPFGQQIFIDLKMWNGSRTMIDIARELVHHGADYFNVYALADELIPMVVEVTRGSHTRVLGLTVLSHFNETYCKKHFGRTFKASVSHFAKTAIDRGCDGIILPGTMLDAAADLKIAKIVTGIRPSWYKDDRHEQEIEPSVAKTHNADFVVCGNPIMDTRRVNPIDSLRRISEELQ